jgi:hypothetical protein
VSLESTTEGGGYGFSVCFAFFGEFCETCVSRIAVNLGECGELEEVLPEVGLVIRHGRLLMYPWVVQRDNSASSVTRSKLLSIR